MILAVSALFGCSNAIPTVESLSTIADPKEVPAKDPRNFAQINAGSAKETVGAYKGNVRISQSLGDMQATSNGGYKLKGTVTLQR
ncbi:hypothetical protein [Bdellovibrio sp. HCB337]|uniref:hypothetical protein n=1 Tax=Bdellovibrio sp. HCB337 TaxID=3394358 RepID=UPI0039A5B3EC